MTSWTQNLFSSYFLSDPRLLTTRSITEEESNHIRNVQNKVVRKGRSSEDIGAVFYQEFLNGKGSKKTIKKSEEAKMARSANSNYLSYKVKTSDGSHIYLPIIRG